MRCRKCGADIPDNKIYCEKCGSPIQMVPDYSPEEDIRIGEEKKNAQEGKSSAAGDSAAAGIFSGKRKYILAGALALACGVLIYQTAYRAILIPAGETAAEADALLEKPEFSLPSGNYSYMPSLTISHPERENGLIFYTTDGSTPDEFSQVFNGPIQIGEGQTVVRAVFIRSDGLQSEEADGTYQVIFDYPDEPEFSVEGGEYAEPFYVTVTAEPDCEIHYTTDGSDPDVHSPVCRDSVYIPPGLTVLRAVSVDEEGDMSGIMEAIYNVAENIQQGGQDAENMTENTMGNP